MSRKLATKRQEPKRRRMALADSEFTALEQRFIDEFMVDQVATYALKRAGSSAKHLHQQASEYMRKPHIAREIQRRISLQAEKAIVDKTWLMTELVLTYQAAKAAAGVTGGNPAERTIALRALEKIGMHVDVNAFRHQVGIGNPDGSTFDLSGLSDEQIEQLETIVSALAVANGDSGGESPTIQ